MKILINGSKGRLGKEVNRLVLEGYRGSSLAGAVDRKNISSRETLQFNKLEDFQGRADCLIDFSNHINTRSLVKYGLERKLPLVIATTGQSEEELEVIRKASKEIPIFLAANTSLGIAILLELAKTTVKMMPEADIEIVEKHHNKKLDSPSGTALLLADEIKEIRKDAKYVYGRSGMKKREKEEIGIHALRMGSVVGEHEIIVSTDNQTITLKHEAHNKALFAEGALVAGEFLIKKAPGLYGMKDLID